MKDFKDLKVYQLALKCFQEAVTDIEKFPKNFVAKIISDQLIRSISSISANIAEGYGRKRGKEYIHFLYISRGSTAESIDWYEKLKMLGYVTEEEYASQVDTLEHIRAILSKMINTLSK